MTHANPVLIVGAGPVGLVLAVELARRQVPFRLIDKNRHGATESRAAALWPRSLEVFHHLGIIKAALAAGNRIAGMRFMAAEQTLFRLDFTSVDSPYAFGLALPQSTTEELLEERLTTLGGVIERGLELTNIVEADDHIEALVHGDDGTTEVIRAAWVVGCDGAHSGVRSAAGMEFHGAAYSERWGLGDVQLDAPLSPHEGLIYLGRGGPVGMIAFNEAGSYRVFTPLPKTFGQDSEAPHGKVGTLDLREFESLVRRRVPLRPLIMSQPKWLAVFSVHRRLVDQLRVGRVLLAGDAAHIQSPAGGQGMNTGIQDAFNLGWKLALVVQGLAGEQLLDSYHTERHGAFVATARMTDAMLKVMTIKQPVGRWLVAQAAKSLMRLKRLRLMAAAAMSEVAIAYPASPIVRDAWSLKAAPAPGERAPQVALPRDGRHLVLLFAGSPYQLQTPTLLNELVQELKAQWDQVAEVRVVSADDHATHQLFGADFTSLFIIRPDGHIGLRSRNVAASEVAGYFTDLIGVTPQAADEAGPEQPKVRRSIKAPGVVEEAQVVH